MKPIHESCPVCGRPSPRERWNISLPALLDLVENLPPVSATDETVCMNALADLYERDIAELEATKQPGWEAVCGELKKAVTEIRQPKREGNGK